jgi:hypothetical protein
MSSRAMWAGSPPWGSKDTQQIQSLVRNPKSECEGERRSAPCQWQDRWKEGRGAEWE